jgi:hypothetical protein
MLRPFGPVFSSRIWVCATALFIGVDSAPGHRSDRRAGNDGRVPGDRYPAGWQHPRLPHRAVVGLYAGICSIRFLLWGMAFELVFAVAIIYVPALQPVFGTAPLDPLCWLLPGARAPLVLLAEETRNLYARRRAAARGGSLP